MYNAKDIEKKWQKYWQEHNLYKTDVSSDKPKMYVLDMFPYPSGDGLHIGHTRIYTASDVIARMKRMQGYNVLHPTGWDAFGLPAENYAIRTGTHPRATTEKNIANIKRQMQEQGFLYDWSREINTTDPQYYKWTQWIFIQLFKKGLAHEAEIPINWCPKDKTGLANEEVVNGKCDRCGTLVERRTMKQWVLKITEYAEALLKDLQDLHWPEHIKTMQRNWIGKSEGANIRFLRAEKPDEFIEVFTTRPDTLFGATYMVLSPEHELVDKIVTNDQKAVVQSYVKDAGNKSDMERTEFQKNKTGVFTGAYAINPINGEKIPIWVADYVLASYGTGAIMAVPAHDERDYAFADKYKLPMRAVISDGAETASLEDAFTGEDILTNSGKYDGLDSAEAKVKIVKDLSQKGLAEFKVTYHLRDWVFSRQRYWGEPIPIVHCAKCGAVAVPEDQLPVVLPEVQNYQPTGTGQSPLAGIADWVNTTCPNCDGPAKRETNTMPQWAGSSWYYLRFCDPHNQTVLADAKALAQWMPVDIYIGGAEHAVLHLLYARFWHKVLFDLDIVKQNEPFTRLESIGILATNAYKDADGKWVHIHDVKVDGQMAFQVNTGAVLTASLEKMSKSKLNVISPDMIIDRYGADTLRTYILFLGDWHEMSLFDLSGIEGAHRFLKKAASLLDHAISETGDPALDTLLAQSILKVTADIDQFAFNTAVSQLMILLNNLLESKSMTKDYVSVFIKLLSPIAPHLAEELWQKLGNKQSVLLSPWPTAREVDAQEITVTIIVQVNGKVRARLNMSRGASAEELKQAALSHASVVALVTSLPKKVIVVPDRLVNIVI